MDNEDDLSCIHRKRAPISALEAMIFLRRCNCVMERKQSMVSFT